MKALVVSAHPCDDSYTAALAATAAEQLAAGGHEVTLLDLYAIGFDATMGPDELADYAARRPPTDEVVRAHGELVGAAEILVFVYPTWWSGLPAILKGWLDRVLVPGVAFDFDAADKVRPHLRGVRYIVGVSTYGSPWSYVKLMTDGGRRMLTRALRLCCASRPRVRWMGLYAMENKGLDDRKAFLDRVGHQLRGLG